MFWGCIDLAEEARLTKLFDQGQVQSSFLFRSLRRARKISQVALDDEGRLVFSRIKKLIRCMENDPLPFYDKGAGDLDVVSHFSRILQLLVDSSEAKTLLSRFSLPLDSHYIEDLVRQALGLEENGALSVADVRRAVLSAVLTPLRQNVGSCFATAPAILIQKEQPIQLLEDLYDLLTTSTLTRTFGGSIYTVPLAMSSGIGDLKKVVDFGRLDTLHSPAIQAALQATGLEVFDCPRGVLSVEEFFLQALCEKQGVCLKTVSSQRFLQKRKEVVSPGIERLLHLEQKARTVFKGFIDHALLKTWEFTLAGFSDYKVEFYRWNLFTSLGMDPKEPGGIGSVLYEKITEKLDQANEELEKEQKLRDQAALEAQSAKTLLRSASSDHRFRSLKAEAMMHANRAESHDALAQKAHKRATYLSQFFQFFSKHLFRYFPTYFQEIYDPEMLDLEGDFYDDSPAGFRLVFKHGRSDPSVWTPIFDGETFQKMLTKFLILVEGDIAASLEWKEGEKQVCSLVTALVHHIGTSEFLDSALQRMAKRLSGREEIKGKRGGKKPWSYISGGTVHALIKCYYALEKELTEEKTQASTPMELLIFLLDTLKALPHKTLELTPKNPVGLLLMYSPTHVFCLRPSLPFFQKGWSDPGFSYTWVRDQVFLPGKVFYEKIQIDRYDQEFLIKTFLEKQKFALGAYPTNQPWSMVSLELEKIAVESCFATPVGVNQFCSYLIELFGSVFGPPSAVKERVIAFLRLAFPLVSDEEGMQIGKSLLEPWKKAENIFTKKRLSKKMTWEVLYRNLLRSVGESTEGNRLAYLELIELIRKKEIGPPLPLLFADTNWDQLYFGFALNPATMSLDLWRTDRFGLEGFPMESWESVFSQKENDPWGIFVDPTEYRGRGRANRSWVKA